MFKFVKLNGKMDLLMIRKIHLFLLLFPLTVFIVTPAFAIVDPLSVPNNRFGIHIIQATPDESKPAAELVNANGDWGYVTVLVESGDRNHEKWQEFFNDLRRRHLIPLVRLATQPEGNYWKLPYDGEEQAWTDFLDALNWPTKNRYVIIYNEPNHATEWGNKIDAYSYSKVLDKTITALKNKNRDFFVLNAGFDASAPSNPPRFEDQIIFMKQMNEAVPGIFERLDGWVSHSYPNPAFAGSPYDSGRGTVRTYLWELQQLKDMGVTKSFPVFISETGWKHAEGLIYDSTLPSADTVAGYYKHAFEYAWNTGQIAAITPFLLNYQESPFDHFSFKKVAEIAKDEFYAMNQVLQDMPKVLGKPIQEIKSQLTKGEIYHSIVSEQSYTISLTFKNIGQSIWNDREPVKLQPIEGGGQLGITPVELPKEVRIEPGQEYTFKISLRAPESGTYKVSLNLFEGVNQFFSNPVEFTTEVKAPVILKIMSMLGWKKNHTGSYYLWVKGAGGENVQKVDLNSQGISEEIEARYLLPDYSFEFSLEKPFYVSKTLNQTVYAGVNILNFGTLQPDILPALLYPWELWKLLPFSN